MAGQPPIDRHAALSRAEGQAAHELARHQAGTARLLLRIIALPIWLPFYVARVILERQAMVTFVRERSGVLTTADAPGRELALAWVAQNPARYPHGQYDRRFNKLERRFSRLAHQCREDNR